MRIPLHTVPQRASGFTLVELLVVLIIIALALGLAAPALLSPPVTSASGVQRVVDRGRRAAVRRAGPLVLTIETDGRWRLATPGTETNGVLESGTLADPPTDRIRVRLTPLGACMPADERAVTTLDAVRCRTTERP
ncbi:MAG: prepilin-type N-terminal cleavage/methylation domain-containing protein [Gemmatimonadetes bacterium]|nr:prepilin-type N-terminal cleavage/methylation domain-containing protein [Gemmatimonadota bacterium]